MRAFSIVLLSLSALSVQSFEQTEGIHEARVVLADRSEETRTAAIRSGLEQVLVRYSGFSELASLKGMDLVLGDAERYVSEYGVEKMRISDTGGLGSEEVDGLWIRFSADLLDQLANNMELPVWPTLRPTLDYVLVIELWGEPHIPGFTERPGMWLGLEQLFANRGLSAHPLQDLASRQISARDVWQLNQQTVESLRNAGDADVLLVIRAHQSDDGYNVDVLSVDRTSHQLVRSSDVHLIHAVGKGVNAYLDTLSLELSFLGGSGVTQEMRVQVTGIRSFSEYRRVLDLIAGLEQVLDVHLESTDDRSMQFIVEYQSDQDLLTDAIATIAGLVYVQDAEPGQQERRNPEPKVHFRYPQSTFLPPVGVDHDS